jgi:gamma-glutamyltranspeptidase / glutathione hydrolase
MAWTNKGLAHRPVVMGKRGACASAHYLSTLAGQRMLMQGGNAVDAAVAIAAALNVVEPYMSGAGGVGYMFIYDAKSKKRIVLDYNGPSAYAAELSKYKHEDDKQKGILSPLIPGSLGGWLTALEKYGTMDRATVFQPAIEYAEGGFPLSINNERHFKVSEEYLLKWKTSREQYAPEGHTPTAGTILKQPNLARTFRTIVEGGMEAFYKGEIGKEIVRFSEENGGLITQKDLDDFHPEWVEPITVNYRGYDVYCPPPPCSGIQYLETLNIVEGFDMVGMGQNSAAYIHHLAEAMKLAVADRAEYAPAPNPPTEGLLSKEYAAYRRSLINPTKAGIAGGDRYTSKKKQDEILAGDPYKLPQSTTHFDAVDEQGNAVSATQTLGGGFGSGVVFGSTGLALNNFTYWMDMDPESPNAIGPHKRVEQCLAPAQIWKDDRLFMVIGTPGSFGIMETTPQMMLNILDHGFSIQAGIEAPRFRTANGTELLMEGRIPEEVRAQLRQWGHNLLMQDNWTMMFGGGQGVMVDPDSGALMGGADPRRDGYAMAW